MTIKEIADVWGLDISALNKRVKELFPESVQKGRRTDLNEAQVAILSAKLKESHQAAESFHNKDIIMGGSLGAPCISTPLTVASLEPELRLLRAKEEMQAAYGAVIDKPRYALDNKTKELDQAKEWYSVKRVVIETGTMYPWGPLKDYSIENGYVILKAFDANYKSCNLYHIDVWYAVYGIELCA